MEREKMVKEIAKKVCIACGKCKELKGDCYLSRNVASVMFDAGYRKVPDGAVVLTPEERDEEMKEYNRDRAEREEQVRKETAREIFDGLMKAERGDGFVTYTWSKSIIKQLANEYGVEVE